MGGFVPTIAAPPLQELARRDHRARGRDYGFWVLVICVLLNRAGRAQAQRALGLLLQLSYDGDPMRLAGRPLPEIEEAVRCCGFQRRRSQTLALLAVQWTRKRHAYSTGARPVDDLPGVGDYAVDAFAVFVGGRLDASPADPVLAEWVRIAPRRPTRDATYFLSVGRPGPKRPRTKGSAMSATAEQTQTQPKDLTVGTLVRINDEVQGLVEKVDKKGGRLAIVEEDAGTTCRIRFRDVFRVETIEGLVEAGEEDRARGLFGDGPVDEWCQANGPFGPIGGEAAEELASQVQPDALRFPTAQELEAERQAATEAKKARATTRKPGSSRKYPEEITDAVRRAKKARGTTNGAPGAKQHVHAREVLERRLGRKPAAWSSLLEASDPGTDRTDKTAEKLLRDLASGKAPKEKLKVLHPLAQSMSDPFCKGRNLASILVAWGEQLQVGADVEKVRAAK